jgi:hypothetical protein
MIETQTPDGGTETFDPEIYPLVLMAREHGCRVTGASAGGEDRDVAPAYLTLRSVSRAFPGCRSIE